MAIAENITENGGVSPTKDTSRTKEGENPAGNNGSVPTVTVVDDANSVSTPTVKSMRTRPISESSEFDHSPSPNVRLLAAKDQDGHSFTDCFDANIPDFQSTYSINDLPGCAKGEIMPSQLPAPPDGGYGWVIVFAAFLCNFIVDGISNSFGPFIVSYQDAFHSSKAGTSLIGSLLIGVYLLAGPVAGGLLNRFEVRKVVIGGTLVASVAFAVSALSPNIFVHYLLYGILGGTGFGFIYLPSIVIVSQYFESKRALATGISVAGSGFGTFLMPLIAKSLIETFGWKGALCGLAALILTCALCGICFRPLPIPEFDAEKQNKVNEEVKQRLLTALERVDEVQEYESTVSVDDGNAEVGTTAGGISPVRRSGATRASFDSDYTDVQPLVVATNGVSGVERENNEEESNDPESPANRPPLSPIPEGVSRRLSKKRAASQYHPVPTPADGAAASTAVSRHPTMISQRARKQTLASMTSDMTSLWMGSSSHLRQSRANLTGQLSRVSARSYAHSLSRISQAPQSIKPGESVLSIAMSGVEPKEFARPMSRHDIFLQGSIRNLREFDNEGGNYQRYRESQISIPLAVAAQNMSSNLSQMAGDIAESSYRFGGSQYSRITGGFEAGDVEYELPVDDGKFKWIPLPIRHAFSEMIDLKLLFDPVMAIICVSNILAMLGFYVPFVYLIELAIAKDISASESTLLLSFIGIANTFGRVFFGWMADRRWVTALAITNFSLITCGLLTAICPLLPNYASLTLYSVLFGFIVAAYVCLTSIVLSDLLGVERLTNSFGLLVVARGIASLLGTPIAGVVFDLTQSYSASFYFAGTLILLSGLVSCVVPFVHRHQRSKHLNEGDYVEQQKKLVHEYDQLDQHSAKLSVLTERSEENLTEYQRTIQSINQQRALMYELEEYKQRNEAAIKEEACDDDEEQQHENKVQENGTAIKADPVPEANGIGTPAQ